MDRGLIALFSYVGGGLIFTPLFIFVRYGVHWHESWPKDDHWYDHIPLVVGLIIFWFPLIFLAFYAWVWRPLRQYATELVVTPTGKGYWIKLRTGVLMPFGDAYRYDPDSKETINANACTPSDSSICTYNVLGQLWRSGEFPWFGLANPAAGSEPLGPWRASDVLVLPNNVGYYALYSNGVVRAYGSAEHFGDLRNLRSSGVEWWAMKPFDGTRPARCLAVSESMEATETVGSTMARPR